MSLVFVGVSHKLNVASLRSKSRKTVLPCLLTQDTGHDRYKYRVCIRHAYKSHLLLASGLNTLREHSNAYSEQIDKE